MGKIKSIHMKTDHVFTGENSSLNDCRDANFIYGPNGSGKSTISNYLRNPDATGYESCEILWEGDECAISVYNREWREENFKEQAGLPGVFTLGSNSVQAQKKLADLQGEFEKTQDHIKKDQDNEKSKSVELQNKKSSFATLVWDQVYKPVKETLGLALVGYRNSVEKFADRLICKPPRKPSLSREEAEGKTAELFSGDPVELALVDTAFLDSGNGLLSIEEDAIWGKVVAGNDDVGIAALIERLGNSDWVSNGRSFIRESNVCPFCQKETIDEDFRSQLIDFFDETYEKELAQISSFYEDYKKKGGQLVESLKGLLENSDYFEYDGKMDCRLDSAIGDLSEVIERNSMNMQAKKTEPSRKLTCSSSKTQLDECAAALREMNSLISEHNESVANLKKAKSKLAEEVWLILQEENSALIQSHLKQCKGLETAITGLRDRIDEKGKTLNGLKEEIIEARKDVVSIQPAVDEINRSLKAYGFENFHIQVSEDGNGYRIVRQDGTSVENTLSEGEETFIAFLYFMQTVEGTLAPDSATEERIVVIDDPICSLDSTILYIVSSMVKELVVKTKEKDTKVVQVFVLTHNAFFHKEATFFHGRKSEDEHVVHWMISKDGMRSTIVSHGVKNPIKTSYELLWSELKNEDASVITVQNAMRRIIENYFGMLGSAKPQLIEQSFETVEERRICQSLFAWMNDGSHSIPDDLCIDSYSESPDKYRQVFKRIFQQTGNEEHYNMMTGESGLLSSENED